MAYAGPGALKRRQRTDRPGSLGERTYTEPGECLISATAYAGLEHSSERADKQGGWDPIQPAEVQACFAKKNSEKIRN